MFGPFVLVIWENNPFLPPGLRYGQMTYFGQCNTRGTLLENIFKSQYVIHQPLCPLLLQSGMLRLHKSGILPNCEAQSPSLTPDGQITVSLGKINSLGVDFLLQHHQTYPD